VDPGIPDPRRAISVNRIDYSGGMAGGSGPPWMAKMEPYARYSTYRWRRFAEEESFVFVSLEIGDVYDGPLDLLLTPDQEAKSGHLGPAYRQDHRSIGRCFRNLHACSEL
jgi:hypothetical protein